MEGTTGAVASMIVRAKMEGAALRTNDAKVSGVRASRFNTRPLPHGRWVRYLPNRNRHPLATGGARVYQVGVNPTRYAVTVMGADVISEIMRSLACDSSVEGASQVVPSLISAVVRYRNML